MKKVTLWLALLCILLSCSGCGEKQQDTPAVLYRQTSYTNEYLTDGEVTAMEHFTYTYNTAGQVILSVRYENGEEISRTETTYDAYGSPVLQVTYSAQGQQTRQYRYTRDERQNILREECIDDGVSVWTTDYTYDQNGRETCRVFTGLDPGGNITLTDQTESFYDRDGNLVQTKRTFSDTTGYHISDYENGKQIRFTAYFADGTVDNYVEYTYDENGNLTRWFRHYGDDRDNSGEIIRDDSGLTATELHYDGTGVLQNNKDVFTYDEHGNCILQERYDRDGKLYWRIRHTYEIITQS